MTRYVVGVDAGGTTTRAVAMDETGNVIAEAKAGPGNPLTVGFDAAADAVAECVQEVAQDAAPALTCIGMAGIAREWERNTIIAALVARGLPNRGWDHDVARLIADQPLPGIAEALLDHDAMIALAACTGCRPGIALIAGTGSIAFGVDERGERLRSGGWGHTFDDLGSAHWIGREMLAAVFQAHDGRAAPTMMADLACQALDAPDVPTLTTRVHTSSNPKATVAALAPLCGQAAAAGDAAATRIIAAAGAELARMVEAVLAAGSFVPERVPVGLQGGAFANVEGLGQALTQRLAGQARIEIRRDAPAPVRGAAMLAARALRGLET